MVLKADKRCPKCESTDYRFRARRNLAAAVETKYSCVACGHTWKVQVTAPPATVSVFESAVLPLWEVDAPENL